MEEIKQPVDQPLPSEIVDLKGKVAPVASEPADKPLANADAADTIVSDADQTSAPSDADAGATKADDSEPADKSAKENSDADLKKAAQEDKIVAQVEKSESLCFEHRLSNEEIESMSDFNIPGFVTLQLSENATMKLIWG